MKTVIKFFIFHFNIVIICRVEVNLHGFKGAQLINRSHRDLKVLGSIPVISHSMCEWHSLVKLQ